LRDGVSFRADVLPPLDDDRVSFGMLLADESVGVETFAVVVAVYGSFSFSLSA
jgi:hypothetical protein